MTAWQQKSKEASGGCRQRARRGYEYFREAAKAGGRRGAGEGGIQAEVGGLGTWTAGLGEDISVREGAH